MQAFLESRLIICLKVISCCYLEDVQYFLHGKYVYIPFGSFSKTKVNWKNLSELDLNFEDIQLLLRFCLDISCQKLVSSRDYWEDSAGGLDPYFQA